jgi:mannose-6-phosphate isomerase-like protein (cupin superfamily)
MHDRIEGSTVNARPIAENADDKEAFHREAEARVKTFRYEKPTAGSEPKQVVELVRSTLFKALVQVVHDGGENNLHYHVNSETGWMVLRGRARFYGVDDVLLAELGPNEGIFIPGGARYWFEKTGDEDLEILQMVGLDRAGSKRINVEAHKSWMTDNVLQQYEAR